MIDVNLLFTNNAVYADCTEEGAIDTFIPAIDASARVNGQSSFIINFDNHRLLYKTEQMIYIDEATVKDFKRDCPNPYWALISEETLNQLAVIHRYYPKVYSQLTAEEFKSHICVIDYPITVRNHQLFINQKFTPIVMRNDGITKAGLFTVTHSTKKHIESTIITTSGRRFRFDFKLNEFVEYNLNNTLTITEKTILHRAKMGMTTEEIANNLFLSVNTVKTHKLKIFKKLQVDTITEALTVVGNYQLI